MSVQRGAKDTNIQGGKREYKGRRSLEVHSGRDSILNQGKNSADKSQKEDRDTERGNPGVRKEGTYSVLKVRFGKRKSRRGIVG